MNRRSLRTFLACEALGASLMLGAYLLPRQPGPVIPVILLVVGFLLCFTGLTFLTSGRRTRSVEGMDGAATPGLWLGGGGHGHGDCGGGHAGGGDGSCGDGGGGH